MLYKGLKDEALAIHEKCVNKYNETYDKMSKSCEKLYNFRQGTITLISDIETLINSIANSPKDYSVKISQMEGYQREFKKTEEYVKESYEIAINSGAGIASGVAGGAAVSSLAPKVAMWIATTFGKASTGTAISSLSGAVAKKAALAWLGRGALSAGGAGVAGGQALLALAGPIGWGITGASTVVSVVALSRKNKEISEQAMEEAKDITIAGAQLQEATEKIENIFKETELLNDKVKEAYIKLHIYEGRDFSTFSDEIKLEFGSFVNETLSLAKMLSKSVGD